MFLSVIVDDDSNCPENKYNFDQNNLKLFIHV